MNHEWILYQYPGGEGVPSLSPPCVRVELAMRRMEVPFTIHWIRSSLEVKKVSPTGRVPAVRRPDGSVIAESTGILDALEAAFPGRPITPADPAEAARDRAWESLANETLYWCGFYLRWIEPGGRARMFDAVFGRAALWKRMLVRLVFLPELKRRANGHGIGRRTTQEVEHAFARALDAACAGLEGGPFLGGRDVPGRGDLALASVVIQGGFRGTLPAAKQAVLARPALRDHAAATFRACNAVPPPWLVE